MDDKLYDEIPAHVLGADDLGEYAAFLQSEKAATVFGMNALDRVDNPRDLARAVMAPQLTEKIRIRILEGIRKGHYPERAAARSGVPTKLWQQWMQQASKGIEPFAAFLSECMIAEAECEDEQLSKLDPKFLMERRFSRPSLAEDPTHVGPRWRKQTNIELTNAGSLNEVDVSAMKPEERARYLMQMAKQAEEAARLEREKRDAITNQVPIELPEWAGDVFNEEDE